MNKINEGVRGKIRAERRKSIISSDDQMGHKAWKKVHAKLRDKIWHGAWGEVHAAAWDLSLNRIKPYHEQN